MTRGMKAFDNVGRNNCDNKWATNRRRDLTVLIYGKALPEGTTYAPRVETIFISKDTYEAKTEKRVVGTIPISTQAPTAAPTPTV